MKIVVHFFARARDLAGAASTTLDMPAGATIRELRARLAKDHPGLQTLLERSALAINDQLVDDNALLTDDAEVALLPPVSGG